MQERTYRHGYKNAYEKTCEKIEKEASVAVEAALTVPIVFLVWMAFLYLFQILQVQETLHYAVSESVRTAARLGYLIQKNENIKISSAETEPVKIERTKTEWADRGKIEELLEENLKKIGVDLIKEVLSGTAASIFYKSVMTQYLDTEWIDGTCVRNGYSGICILNSDLLTEKSTCEVVLAYEFVIPFLPEEWVTIPVVQRICVRSFVGDGQIPETDQLRAEETQEALVYVTETGSVYHTNSGCPYIRVVIFEKPYRTLVSLTNAKGQKYRTCTYCGNRNPAEQIYITKYGEVYHVVRDCSAIKREVKEISLAETEGRYRLCSRCAKTGSGK